ncbi:MAG: hypothetical protein ABIG44_12445 [Planctomycetota bacterium]
MVTSTAGTGPEYWDHLSRGYSQVNAYSMTNPETSLTSPLRMELFTWIGRLRYILAVGLVSAGLFFTLNGHFLPTGLARPATLAVANSFILAAIVLTLVLLAGSYVGTLLAGPKHCYRGLTIVSLGLALWATTRGTIDEWLKISASAGAVGPPTSGAYWPLLCEYLFLLLVMLGVAALSALAVPLSSSPATPMMRIRRAFALNTDNHHRMEGLLALLINIGVIGILMLVLTGPAEAWTLRGQVYFAVAVSCALAVFISTRLVRVRHPIWFWPAPILAGILGTFIAVLNPDLLISAGYNQLNSIPAWGLVRPLPIEMVGVGVAATILSVRATTPPKTI